MTVTKKQFLPALHKSDNLKSPDFPSVEDKNYTSTILKYANLALPFPQLDTNAKTVVAAINELYHTKSTVIPNPPGETPTDTLNTVKIDGTVFDIEGGGGGSYTAGNGIYFSKEYTENFVTVAPSSWGYSQTNCQLTHPLFNLVSITCNPSVGEYYGHSYNSLTNVISINCRNNVPEGTPISIKYASTDGDSIINAEVGQWDSDDKSEVALYDPLIRDYSSSGQWVSDGTITDEYGTHTIYKTDLGTYGEESGNSNVNFIVSGAHKLRIYVKQDYEGLDTNYAYVLLSDADTRIRPEPYYRHSFKGENTPDYTYCEYYPFSDGRTKYIQISYHKEPNPDASQLTAHKNARAYIYVVVTENYTGGIHKEIFNTYFEDGKNIAAGDYSHAEGHYSWSESFCSHAEGYKGYALGAYSHAEGCECRAIGNQAAHAEGYGTIASGYESSHSEGYETVASGTNTHSEGYRAKATNKHAHAEGGNTLASGQGSHAEGESTKASGLCSHAEGDQSIASDYATHAEGSQTSASGGGGAHAEGQSSIAIHAGAHAEGYHGEALETASHAEGNYTKATQYTAHAEGNYSIAEGKISHAEGEYTDAVGSCSHAEGASFNVGAVRPSASAGNMSHVEGYLSTTGVNAIGAHVEGMPIFKHSAYNSSTTYNTGDIVYILASSGELFGNNYPVIWYKALRDGVQGITPGTDYTTWEWFNSSDPEDYFTPIAYYTDSYTGNGVAKIMNLSQRAIKISEVKINDVEVSNYTFEDNCVVFTEAPAAGDNISIKYITSFGSTSISQAGHAEGVGTLVDNIGGHAEGYHTHAAGGYSHVEGYATYATNWASHAEGYATKATRNYAHAEGAYSEANGYCSHAEGYDTRVSGSYGHAEGYQTKAFQDYAHAEGGYSEASGYFSHAEGYQTSAYSNSSHSEGYQCIASAQSAHSEGYISKSYGSYSHAEGYCTMATADAAHSEGYQCNSYASYSHTQNLGTQVVMPANTAIGKYNSFANNSGAIDAALMVGNGTDADHRSNAAVIYWTGDAEFAGDITLGTPLSTTAQTVAAAINELYASGGGGSVVTVTQKVSTGTNIADITVNGTTTQLFAPTSGGSNVSVTQIQSSGNQVASITVDGTTTMLYSKAGVESATVTADLSSGTKVATITVDGTATDVYAPDAGDSVTVTQITSTGTHIADIEVDGVTTKLYAPNAGGAVIDDNDIALDKTWSSYKINEMFFELAQRVAAIERYLWGQPVLTEDGDNRVTEDGAQRILEENE